MKTIQLIPDTAATYAVFEVSDKQVVKTKVICWALVEGYALDGNVLEDNQIIGMIVNDEYPVLMTIDENELKFIGYYIEEK